ncbi:unnamed protein product, partial [marine sediment metagenome]
GNELRTIIGQGVYEGVIGLLQGSLPANQEFTGRERVFLRPSEQNINVNDGDTVLTIEYAEEIRNLIRIAREKDNDDNGPPPLPEYPCPICEEVFSTQEALNEHIQREHAEEPIEEKEIFVADAGDIHRLLSDRWFAILLDETINVRVTLQFNGSINGILTAKTRSEISSILNLTDGISKASEILGEVKITATIYKSQRGIK